MSLCPSYFGHEFENIFFSSSSSFTFSFALRGFGNIMGHERENEKENTVWTRSLALLYLILLNPISCTMEEQVKNWREICILQKEDEKINFYFGPFFPPGLLQTTFLLVIDRLSEKHRSRTPSIYFC